MIVKLIEYLNSYCILILPFASLLGFIFSFLFSSKTIKYFSIVILILFLPYLLGCRYIINCFFEILLTLIISIFYYFVIIGIKKMHYKIILSFVTFTLCFIGLFAAFYFSNFFISIKKNSLKINREYYIEYTKIQPFSGRAEERLELNKYILYPIIMKKIDTYDMTWDAYNNCNIVFPNTKIKIDKCRALIMK